MSNAFYAKQSDDGNVAATIKLYVNSVTRPDGTLSNSMHVDTAVHVANNDPDPGCKCGNSCEWINHQTGEVFFNYDTRGLELKLKAVLDEHLNYMLDTYKRQRAEYLSTGPITKDGDDN
jgi:hypothetical protein